MWASYREVCDARYRPSQTPRVLLWILALFYTGIALGLKVSRVPYIFSAGRPSTIGSVMLSERSALLAGSDYRSTPSSAQLHPSILQRLSSLYDDDQRQGELELVTSHILGTQRFRRLHSKIIRKGPTRALRHDRALLSSSLRRPTRKRD
ncbi:hypothetical protein EXIGLDRAFT_762692 [Exidia glandulosa HHB12029]|uniref:Uncharacterized protein n=1 Tax=Exidia glandulosa HHB12029 TaxID=1314781 RepID=A0A165MKB5_EXIGL|nr:hypothetical protein EXIGLDRAFT_762692 [Exidia glandulosa HHB12029]